MKVLVTGGAGFIGGHIVEQLLDRGDEVRVLDFLLPAAWGDTAPDVDPRAEFVRGDLRDSATVRKCLSGVDVVCHQSAMVGLGVDLSDLPSYVGHNDLATSVLLAECARAGIGRLVLASSMVVYGEGLWSCIDHGDVRPASRKPEDLERGRFDPPCPECGRPLRWGLVNEAAQLNPRSVYAVTKVAQEQLAEVWSASTGGTAVALRYHNVYGPRMPRDTPYSGVAAIFRSRLERGQPPQVFEDGAQMRDFVHVSDVARANLLAIDSALEGFVPLNVCSGMPRSVGEMASALASAYGGPAPIVTGQFRPGDVRHVVASPEAAAQLLGFRAECDPAAGMAEFAEAPLRGNGDG